MPIVDGLEQAQDNPALAVLSAICNGGATEVEANDVVLADHEFISERLRKLVADSQAIGEARGRARAEARAEARGGARVVLLVLEARGVPVPAEFREQVLDCTDRELIDQYIRRAATATTIGDVL